MKKFLWITLSCFLLAMGCALYTAGPEAGYPPGIGGPQEYGANRDQEYGAARDYMDIDYMYDYLAPYGNWIEMEPYGYVWTPSNMGYRWRPYSDGHWVSTDDGWTWISYEEWGSIPFHYGRWGYDNDLGWFWVPGTVWGPAWVSWRWSNQYVGWAPLPPGVEFRAGMGFTSLSFRIPNRFWIFLQSPRFLDRDIYRFTLPYERNVTIINFTSIHNNIYYRNDRIINEGIGVDYVRRVTGRTVPRYTVRDVREPGRARVAGNDVHIYRPAFRADTTAKAKPKTFRNRNQARRVRELAPVSAPESAVRRRQAQQKALVEKTQAQELKNIERKRAAELAQIRDNAEKSRISQDYRGKMDKLQRQHQAEKQQLIKRNQQDIERVKQAAQRVKQQQQQDQQRQFKKKKSK